MQAIPDAIALALTRMGLLAPGAPVRGEALSGGVSSDIWRVDLPRGPVCVKRALSRLRVAADWQAPVERSRYEAAWLAEVARVCPGFAPALLGADQEAHALCMAYLDPAQHRLWKSELRAGRADPADAAAVAGRLVAVHAGTADDPAVAARFASDAIFHAIRLEPYLLATARAHPALAGRLHGPRVLPQPPAAEMPLDARDRAHLPRVLRCVRLALPGRRYLGSAGHAGGASSSAAAGLVPGARGRQVARGIRDGRGR